MRGWCEKQSCCFLPLDAVKKVSERAKATRS
jgi:hypothetical protein